MTMSEDHRSRAPDSSATSNDLEVGDVEVSHKAGYLTLFALDFRASAAPLSLADLERIGLTAARSRAVLPSVEVGDFTLRWISDEALEILVNDYRSVPTTVVPEMLALLGIFWRR